MRGQGCVLNSRDYTNGRGARPAHASLRRHASNRTRRPAPEESSAHGSARKEPHRDHRRRRDRLQHRLSPGEARRARRAAAGAPAAHARRDVACGGPRRTAAQQQQSDAAHALLGRAVRDARGRDRPGDRLEWLGQPAPRVLRRAVAGAAALRDDGPRLRVSRRPRVAERSARPVPADRVAGRRGRGVDCGRRLRGPDQPHQRLRDRSACWRRDDS